MPSGKIRFYDEDKGFGFITGEDGTSVYLSSSIVGDLDVHSGQRVEYSVAESRRGLNALSIRLLGVNPRAKARPRKPVDEMAVIIEDLVKLLDQFGEELKRGSYPERKQQRQVAKLLRHVAEELDG